MTTRRLRLFSVLTAWCVMMTVVPAEAAPSKNPPKRPVCDEAAEMRDGRPVLPAGATDIEEPVDVDEDRGLVSNLYAGANSGTDDFYPLPCDPSIGGELPPDVDAPPTQDELDADKFVEEFDTSGRVNDLAGAVDIGGFPPLPDVTPGRCALVTKPGTKDKPPVTTPLPCDSERFLRSGQPFEGRDIIYVNGFAREHLKRRATGVPAAYQNWPQDAPAFLDPSGYFRQYSENYWVDHIRENLFDPLNAGSSIAGWQSTPSDPGAVYKPKSNRYLVVAWSTNQRLQYSQHAMLTQIALAMATNQNVVTPPTYPASQIRPFCANKCVIVSHSTGGLLTSTTMARAANGDYGAGGKAIADRMRLHVAFEGANSGSRLASAALALGLPSSPVPHLLCTVFDDVLQLTDVCILDLTFFATSVLVDLVPAVAQVVWGPVLAHSPVPTVTVAGGHPMGNYLQGVTKFFLPGLDDGVVSMNSACGNPIHVSPGALAPSGATMTSLIKAFDMSTNSSHFQRAIKNFLSHKHLQGGATPGPRFLAGGCLPYLSPTGMVMPVANPQVGTLWDTRARYPNYFSFLQGSIDHAYDGATDDANMWPSELGSPASAGREYRKDFGPNTEEQNAVTNGAVYTKAPDGTYLVHPSFAKVREVVRGKKIVFKLFKKKKTIWIWKRTYHLLDKWQTKQSSHYAYEFVGRR